MFQTAAFNTGLRVEFNNSTAALIVADSNLKEGYRVIAISKQISLGQWYQLEIEALNSEYVRVILDGKTVVDIERRGISIGVSEFLLGGGFDKNRLFSGDIKEASIVKGNLPRSIRLVFRHVPRSINALMSLVASGGILLSLLLCALIKNGFFDSTKRLAGRLV